MCAAWSGHALEHLSEILAKFEAGLTERSVTAQAATRMAGRRKFLTDGGFRYANPIKKSCTPGDAYGTFAGQIEHKPDGAPAVARRAKVKRDVPKNIQTAPGRKGGFGTPGTLISTIGAEYVSTPYPRQRRNLLSSSSADAPRRIAAAGSRAGPIQ